jgi:RNA polymerase sigma factor (sigma-70 family)
MDLTDRALVSACCSGDETAWETLIKRYQRLIYSIPRRAGLDEFSSAEVFQNVFTSLVENLDRIKQPDRIRAWLVTTTRRETWLFVRRQKESAAITTSHENEEGEAVEPPDDAPLADEVLLRLEQQQNIRNAVRELDERCRQLLEMLFYCPEPPSYSEIAARLGLREGCIGPTRARCLQKLLRRLEKSGL